MVGTDESAAGACQRCDATPRETGARELRCRAIVLDRIAILVRSSTAPDRTFVLPHAGVHADERIVVGVGTGGRVVGHACEMPRLFIDGRPGFLAEVIEIDEHRVAHHPAERRIPGTLEAKIVPMTSAVLE